LFVEYFVMPTALHVAQVGQTRTSSMGDDDEERSPNGFNTSGSSFTKKLYEILDSSESCDIVCWTQGIHCGLKNQSALLAFYTPNAHLILFISFYPTRWHCLRSEGTKKTGIRDSSEVFSACPISVVREATQLLFF
jgi:hypothetical protein